MPLALLVINLHQHLATFDTGPTSALRTGRFLKGVYFKMQASFMLLCGNDESHSITRTDCISAASIKRLVEVSKSIREGARRQSV
jgi:hypothetical protein